MKKKPTEDALHALWNGDPRRVEKALASADLDHADGEGRTLLMEAVLEKRADLVRILLEHGADPSRADHEGSTALHFAAQAHLPDVAQLLLDKGAPVDPLDHLGQTPLYRALSTFRGEADGAAIWTLLLANADPKVKNKHGVSPEDLSHRPSNYDLLQFFR